MGLVGIHDPDALWNFNGVTHCPWCRKEGQNEGTTVNHLWMVHYSLAWCVTDAMTAHTQHLTLSATTAGRTVTNLGRKILMSQFCLSNPQKKQNCLSWGYKQGGQDGMVYTRLSYWEYHLPTVTALEEDQQIRHNPPTHTPHHLFSCKT